MKKIITNNVQHALILRKVLVPPQKCESRGGAHDLNVAIVKSLDEHSCLIMEEAYKHKYPSDWKTKKAYNI